MGSIIYKACVLEFTRPRGLRPLGLSAPNQLESLHICFIQPTNCMQRRVISGRVIVYTGTIRLAENNYRTTAIICRTVVIVPAEIV
jgi:hypothetical protein